jgi:flagellar basal-body rod protein FlgF
MLKNVYSPLSAGKGQERLLDVLANNIANTNTPGFKEQQVSFTALLSNPWPSYRNPNPPAPFQTNMQELYPLRGNEMGYTATSMVTTSFEQGPVSQTGNPLDVAVQGNGFFVVETPFGERYTRDGSFALTPDGTLVTRSGAVVQGENGPITGLEEATITVLDNGDVLSDDRFIDRLRIQAFEEPELLQRLGDNLYVHDGSPENLTQFTGRLAQHHLEGSNASPMRNMTSMITAHRMYEALQKAIQAQDKTMEKGANEIGLVRG